MRTPPAQRRSTGPTTRSASRNRAGQALRKKRRDEASAVATHKKAETAQRSQEAWLAAAHDQLMETKRTSARITQEIADTMASNIEQAKRRDEQQAAQARAEASFVENMNRQGSIDKKLRTQLRGRIEMGGAEVSRLAGAQKRLDEQVKSRRLELQKMEKAITKLEDEREETQRMYEELRQGCADDNKALEEERAAGPWGPNAAWNPSNMGPDELDSDEEVSAGVVSALSATTGATDRPTSSGAAVGPRGGVKLVHANARKHATYTEEALASSGALEWWIREFYATQDPAKAPRAVAMAARCTDQEMRRRVIEFLERKYIICRDQYVQDGTLREGPHPGGTKTLHHARCRRSWRSETWNMMT